MLGLTGREKGQPGNLMSQRRSVRGDWEYVTFQSHSWIVGVSRLAQR